MIFKREEEKRGGLLHRLREAMRSTRQSLSEKIESVLLGKKAIDQELFEDLEAVLITADIGVETTHEVMEKTRQRVERDQLKDADALKQTIREELVAILAPQSAGSASPSDEEISVKPWVILVVGVNGTGKTTTVAKLAHRFAGEGKTVLLCAADTFRAAAIEQLSIWAQRCGAELVRQGPGSNPSAVVFDALQAAESRSIDIVIADTAGRLHTKSNLMQELEKMKRIAARKVPGAPHEVLLVMDATTGQNGLVQAKEFTRTVGITGLIVTKLDGTAKGGVVFSIVRELGIPIRFAGIGEALEDLIEFSPQAFVASIFE